MRMNENIWYNVNTVDVNWLHYAQDLMVKCQCSQCKSNYIVISNIKYLSKEIIWFKALNYNKLKTPYTFDLQLLWIKEGLNWLWSGGTLN